MLATIGPIADELAGDALDGDPGRRRRRAIRVRRRRPDATRPACGSSAARASTSAAATSTTRSPLASRRSTRSSIFDDVLVPYERCFLLRQPRALQRDLRRDVGGRAHDAPGRDADDGQDGVHARPRLAARQRRSRSRASSTCRRRSSEVIIAVEIVKALLRAAEADAARRTSLGARHTGVGAAERLPQLVPALLAALPGDPAPARERAG